MPKAIFTAALTGAIHTPTMSPYLPVTPDQIVENAVQAHAEGAAVVHVHVRNPETMKLLIVVRFYVIKSLHTIPNNY